MRLNEALHHVVSGGQGVYKSCLREEVSLARVARRGVSVRSEDLFPEVPGTNVPVEGVPRWFCGNKITEMARTRLSWKILGHLGIRLRA